MVLEVPRQFLNEPPIKIVPAGSNAIAATTPLAPISSVDAPVPTLKIAVVTNVPLGLITASPFRAVPL